MSTMLEHVLIAFCSLSCLLFAVEPTGTNYWACEMIAMILIPFGADMSVSQWRRHRSVTG